MYVTDRISPLCKQITDVNLNCESALWVKFAEHFIVGAIYIPCEGSKYHHSDIFGDLTSDIKYIKDKYEMPLMLVGDFNSRTGTLNDIMLLENDDVLDESNFEYLDILNFFNSTNVQIKRKNIDPKVDNNGRKLIEMCKLQELCILNGRAGADKDIGSTTCDNASTIDYIICTPDLLPKIIDFEIDTLDKCLSDKHNPIHANINITHTILPANNQNNGNEHNSTEPKLHCKWDESKKDEYKINFAMEDIDDILTKVSSFNLTEATQSNVDDIANQLKNILLEPAKTVGICKQVNINSNKDKRVNFSKPWFDIECKNSKNNYLRFKRSLPKQPSNYAKTSLRQLANKHKILLRKKKRRYDKERNALLRELKSTNPGEYWSISKGDKRCTKTGNIPINAHRDHFSALNRNENDCREEVPIS